MIKNQRGLSLIGTMIIAAILIGAIVLAMRTVPVYNEYFEVKKAITVIAAGGDVQTPESIRSAFQRRADVGDISSVTYKDLTISKENNRYVISAQWERRIPLVANVALVFSFDVSNAANPAAGN